MRGFTAGWRFMGAKIASATTAAVGPAFWVEPAIRGTGLALIGAGLIWRPAATRPLASPGERPEAE